MSGDEDRYPIWYDGPPEHFEAFVAQRKRAALSRRHAVALLIAAVAVIAAACWLAWTVARWLL